MSPKGKYNSGYWGQECGPEKDPTPERRYKYMEDAISVNTGILISQSILNSSELEDTRFQSHHLYRIEWQPGPDGYLDWYLDDDFIMGIDAKILKLTGSIIPEVTRQLFEP